MEVGGLSRNAQNASIWWKDVWNIECGVDDMFGNWLSTNLPEVISDEESFYFGVICGLKEVG